MRHKLYLLGVILLLTYNAFAHSGKPRIYAIIDTDCAADDLRTICMLLGDHDIEILAITTSEGALTPQQGYQKVKALLNEFHHQGIPVAAGREIHTPAPQWRDISQQVYWGESVSDDSPVPTARELLIKTIEHEKKPVTLICLGSLTNISDVLSEKPHLKEKIGQLVWYNNGLRPKSDTNYGIDPQAARQVMDSGVKMLLVSSTTPESAPLDKQFLSDLGRLKSSRYAQKVAECHATPPLRDLVRNEHLRVWDELTVLALNTPQLFDIDSISPTVNWYHIDTPRKILPIEQQILAIYQGPENVEGKIFYHFPLEESYYIRDIMPIIGRAVQRYGQSEFRAAVLANELHGHLGIFATIGVKMGIRAREYFDIGVDDMQVTTFAGSRPPVSCLNDGLQVSTGGTLGHGLITVANVKDNNTRAEATFKFKDKEVTLRLKPEYERRVREDLKKGVATYGADTEANWQYVRDLAIKYWLDWDRHDIFDILPNS